MAIHEFNLRVVSPMFLNGADTKAPELRAASVRGQLRYWLRAILGAQTDDLSWIWERESAVFGSTGQGSAVSVRVFPQSVSKEQITSASILPHNPEKRDRSKQDAIKSGHKVTVQLVTRPGVKIPDDLINALRLWSLLGGLGKRSRRMFGAIQIVGLEALPVAHTFEDLKNQIEQSLSDAIPVPNPALYKQAYPEFPTLHPNQCAIWIGRDSFTDHIEAEKKLFGLLHEDYVVQRMFGFADYDPQDREQLKRLQGREKREFQEKLVKRRASPLIAQLRLIDGELYPIFTFFRSQPTQINSTSNIDWSIHNKFMAAIQNTFDTSSDPIWGGLFK